MVSFAGAKQGNTKRLMCVIVEFGDVFPGLHGGEILYEVTWERMTRLGAGELDFKDDRYSGWDIVRHL